MRHALTGEYEAVFRINVTLLHAEDLEAGTSFSRFGILLIAKRFTPYRILANCRETEMGPFPLGLSEVSAAKFSRMGRSLDCAIGVGSGLLPATTRWGQRPSRSGTSVGFQMDSHRIPLLERSGRL
jgi:hypothetical protein